MTLSYRERKRAAYVLLGQPVARPLDTGPRSAPLKPALIRSRGRETFDKLFSETSPVPVPPRFCSRCGSVLLPDLAGVLIIREGFREVPRTSILCPDCAHELEQFLAGPVDVLAPAFNSEIDGMPLGNNGIGGSVQGTVGAGGNYITLHQFTATSSFSATSVSLYGAAHTGTLGCTMGIYSDAGGNPGTLLGTTAEVTITSTPGWWLATLGSPVAIMNGVTYWLAQMHGVVGLDFNFDIQAGFTDVYQSFGSYTPGVLPGSITPSPWFADQKFSIFADGPDSPTFRPFFVSQQPVIGSGIY